MHTVIGRTKSGWYALDVSEGRTVAECPTLEAAEAAQRLMRMTDREAEMVISPDALRLRYEALSKIAQTEHMALEETRAIVGARMGETIQDAVRRLMDEHNELRERIENMQNDALERSERD